LQKNSEKNNEKKDNKTFFRYYYDWLSEFCHPNHLGLTLASEPKPGFKPFTIWYENPIFTQMVIKKDLFNCITVSCEFFFYLYDECFSMLIDHENITELIEKPFGLANIFLTSH